MCAYLQALNRFLQRFVTFKGGYDEIEPQATWGTIRLRVNKDSFNLLWLCKYGPLYKWTVFYLLKYFSGKIWYYYYFFLDKLAYQQKCVAKVL